MTRPRTRIRLRIVAACAAALTLTAPLSGCLVTDNGTDVGDLRDGSAQQALDDAANAVDDARQDVADAFDRAQEEVGGSFGEVGDDLTSMSRSARGRWTPSPRRRRSWTRRSAAARRSPQPNAS